MEEKRKAILRQYLRQQLNQQLRQLEKSKNVSFIAKIALIVECCYFT